jgi:hypothetical protein
MFVSELSFTFESISPKEKFFSAPCILLYNKATIYPVPPAKTTSSYIHLLILSIKSKQNV